MAPPQKVSWWHEQIVAWMLHNPDQPLRRCAEHFGVTQPWLSTVINSDAFREYKSRVMEDFNALACGDTVEKLRVAADMSLDRIIERLEHSGASLSMGDLLEANKTSLKALGYGAKAPEPQRGDRYTQNNYFIGDAVDRQVLERARGRIRAQATPPLDLPPFVEGHGAASVVEEAGTGLGQLEPSMLQHDAFVPAPGPNDKEKEREEAHAAFN